MTSPVDYDHDGVDDYTAMVSGAHQEALRHPRYDSGYYQGGYPPDDRGACTDGIWRAFRQVGYDLKAMVDADIASSPVAYVGVISRPDPNIDFRRTKVLGVFLSRHAQRLTNDTSATGRATSSFSTPPGTSAWPLIEGIAGAFPCFCTTWASAPGRMTTWDR